MKFILSFVIFWFINSICAQDTISKAHIQLLKTADSLFEKKEYKLAIGEYTKILKSDQKSEIIFKRAMAAYCLKEYQAAIDDFTVLINKGSFSVKDSYFLRGMCKVSIHQDSCSDFFKAKELGFNADWDMLFSICN